MGGCKVNVFNIYKPNIRNTKMAKLEFGFSREDITPKRGIPLCGYFNPRPNKGAYDRLQLKAAVFRTGKEYAAIVSYDLCLLKRDFIDVVEAELKKTGSILWGKVLYCVTHTHTGPYTSMLFDVSGESEYMSKLVAKTVAALSDALDSLAETELYTARTECTTLAYNRRYLMKNGKVLTNPGKCNPEIAEPDGGVDHSILLMELRQEGRPVMMIANISNHTDTIGGDLVSADWPGRMEAAIQQEMGDGIPVMTIIAPQGNINHFNITSPDGQAGYGEACRIGKAYASVIMSARYSLAKQEDCDLTVRNLEFEAPYYQLSDAEYEEAKRVYEENKDEVMEAGRDFTSEDIARGVPFVKKYFAEAAIGCREKAITEKRVERQIAIHFGTELAIVSLPAEPFVELGFAIREGSRFPMTVLAALGMGEVGYVGMPDNYGNGGYETSPSRGLADPSVGQRMIDGALGLLK